jgi:uncharacterized protein
MDSSMANQSIQIDTLDDLAAGAVFLGTGGGGDPYLNTLIARRVLAERGAVQLIPPDALADDAFVVCVGGIGAPSVGLELLPSAKRCASALQGFEEHMRRKVDALVAVEVGGANSLIPVLTAAIRGVPVVDGDGMGRAFPEAQMTTFSIGGIASTPSVAVDYEGHSALFLQESPRAFEQAIRRFALSRGGVVVATEHPMSGAQLKKHIVPGTMTFAIALGRILRDSRTGAEHVAARLQRAFAHSIYGAFQHLHSGKVVDTASRMVGGYDTGTVAIRAFDSDSTVQIDIRNEFLVARRDRQILAMVPDLITLVDYETSVPINAERLRYGQRVSVFAVGCPAYYRTSVALAAVGPQAFGFDFDYQPLEELSAT